MYLLVWRLKTTLKITKKQCLAQIAVQIVPTPCLANKAAPFMDARTTASRAVAGHKFHFGMVGARHGVAAHLQTQPPSANAFVLRHVGWPGAGVPGG